jgi:hypothetical protein
MVLLPRLFFAEAAPPRPDELKRSLGDATTCLMSCSARMAVRTADGHPCGATAHGMHGDVNWGSIENRALPGVGASTCSDFDLRLTPVPHPRWVLTSARVPQMQVATLQPHTSQSTAHYRAHTVHAMVSSSSSRASLRASTSGRSRFRSFARWIASRWRSRISSRRASRSSSVSPCDQVY